MIMPAILWTASGLLLLFALWTAAFNVSLFFRRRTERNISGIPLVSGIVALLAWGLARLAILPADTSPALTFVKWTALAIVCLDPSGLLIGGLVFIVVMVVSPFAYVWQKLRGVGSGRPPR